MKQVRLLPIACLLIAMFILLHSDNVSAQCGWGGGYICGRFERSETPIGRVYYFFTPYGGTDWAVDPLLTDAYGQQVDIDALIGKSVRIWMPDFNSSACEFPNLDCLTSVAGYEIVSSCEPVVDFYVEREIISPGECTILHWFIDNISGFDGVMLNDECVDPSGSREICPLSDTTYTLRLSPYFGEILREITVQVVAPTATLVPTPTPTPTPSPTPAPTVALPNEDVRHWLDEKAVLVTALETVDIPTNLFPVPGVHAYDESTARELLNRLNVQLEQRTLTPEQVEALQRLTLQERALAQMLPAYTTVAASMSDTFADSIETALGMVFVLRPGWEVCRSKIPFCDRLQKATERMVWRLIRDGGKLAARAIGTAPDQRETGAKVWDLTVQLAENRLSKGRSLAELLMDDGIQAATTAVMIQPYLARTQGLIDKGVRTADLDGVTADRWAITGSTDRATLLLDELVRKAEWEMQDALERHGDFQAAADLADVAEDITDLATLSPLALMAKVVGLGARLEHLFIANLPLIYLNSQNLECIEYLSTRAAEMAFDSAQPGDDCRYRQGMLPPDGGRVVLAAYQPAPATHPLRSQLQDEADDYRQAVQAFTQAVQAGDLDAAAQNLDRLLQAEESLQDTLDMMQAILLERDTLNQNDLALMDRGNAFAAASFALYLASAETLMAQQEGQQPQTDLSQTAQAALSSVDEIEQVVALVNLMPPADQPILVIQSVEAQITPDGQLQVDAKVINVGAGDASDVKVLLLAETMQRDSSADLGVLRGGEETATMLIIPMPTAPLFTVQVWNQGVLMDYQIESLPAVVATPTGIAPTVAPISPAQQPGGICGSLFGAIALPIGVLIWVRRKRDVAGR